ncbi:hypothetical protein EB008_00130 [bacterium]|nr:hypothetical protein [bacterium]
MSLTQRLGLVLIPLFCICGVGFFLGFQFQPAEKEVDSILFCSDKPTLTEPRWLLSYLKSQGGTEGFRAEIQEKDLHPIFRHLTVSNFPPSSVYVYYGLREVAFILGDYENLGLDPEGVLVALHPFQSPKKVPRLFLGPIKNLRLASKLDQTLFKEILELKSAFQDTLDFIDLSKKGCLLPYRTVNLGISQKKNFSNTGKMLLVRLNPDHLKEGVKELQAFLHTVPIVGIDKVVKLDLRTLGIGFLQTVDTHREQNFYWDEPHFWETRAIS